MNDDRLTVELRGLEVFGRHGVYDEERRLGQRFVVDVALDLAEVDSTRTDDLADTVNYARLADAIAAIVSGEPVALLERLAGLIADRCLEDQLVAAVSVTVRKPHVALGHVVEDARATLWRAREG